VRLPESVLKYLYRNKEKEKVRVLSKITCIINNYNEKPLLSKCPKSFSLNTAKYGEVYNINRKDYGKKQYEDDDITVKHGNTSVPIIGEEFSARNKEIKNLKRKNMDINYAHYMMGHMGETALRAMLNHHNIKATGVFHNCVHCMKWKAQNKPVNKEAMNPASYAGERLHIDASGPLPLPMGRKEFWLKI
jgi:hypothetical protein